MSTIEDVTLWGPRDYVKLPHIPDSWRMCDIGPGRYPHPRANVLIDKHPEILEALNDDRPQILSDLELGLPNIEDDTFHFAWCSHALEHVIELQTAVDALNRIAKRGCMVVPSFAKDALLHFQEREHFWHCLPNPTQGGPIVFVEHNNGFIERLREDQLAQQATSFLYQTGSHHDCTAEQHMRAWWQRTEKDLDLVYRWDESNPLKVIIVR